MANNKQRERSSKSAKPTDSLPTLPLPKKAAASIRAVTLTDARKKLPHEFARVLKKTLQKIGVDIATDYAHVFAPLKSRFSDEFHEGSVAGGFAHADTILTSILDNNPTFAATAPIVLDRFDTQKSELIASGVLMRIINRTFLLTAAHVTDHQSEGTLMIPRQQGFMPANGYFSAMRLPASGHRSDDKLDVAYFWLDDDCVNDLDSKCRILERQDVSLDAEPLRRTTYTFAGFPLRRSRVHGRNIEKDFTTFSGVESKNGEYDELGLTRTRHIVMRFHRKQTFSSRLKKVIVSPLPTGMSGGGVYAWSEEAMKEWPIRLPLVGIANEFIPDKCLLVATRLHVYVG